SCMENTGEFADPGVRLASLVGGLGSNARYLTICAPSFAPSLQNVAESVGKVMGPQCIESRLADGDTATPGLQPDCEVGDVLPDDHGAHTEQAIPACSANGNTPPCWTIADGNALACQGSKILAVQRPSGNLSPELLTRVSC